MAYSDALTALADPTRRSVFERLAGGDRSVGEIAAELPVSRRLLPALRERLEAATPRARP